MILWIFAYTVIPTEDITVYPNNKSYVTKDIKKVMNQRKVAFKNRNFSLLRRKKTIKIKLKEAKKS